MAEKPAIRHVSRALIFTGVAAAALASWALISLPEGTVALVKSVEAKVIVFFGLCALLVAVGIGIYNLVHVPTPRRMLNNTWRYIVFVGISVGLGPVGLSALDAHAQWKTGFTVSFEMAGESAAIFAATVWGLKWVNREYRNLAEYEDRHGSLE